MRAIRIQKKIQLKISLHQINKKIMRVIMMMKVAMIVKIIKKLCMENLNNIKIKKNNIKVIQCKNKNSSIK